MAVRMTIANAWQDSLDEPSDRFDVRTVIHLAGENDHRLGRVNPFELRGRIEEFGVDAVLDDVDALGSRLVAKQVALRPR